MIFEASAQKDKKHLSALLHMEGTHIVGSVLTMSNELIQQKSLEINALGNSYREVWGNTIHRQGLYQHALTAEPEEFDKFLNNARQFGVRQRQNFEYCMAIYGGEEAHSVLSYESLDSSGNTIKKFYSDRQWDELCNKTMPTNPVTDGLEEEIQGHHNISVKNPLLSREEAILHAADPENISFQGTRAHLKAHDGDFRNFTNEEKSDVTDSYDAIQNKKVDKIEQLHDHSDAFAFCSAIFSGSISAIITFKQLTNDPRPWNRKKALKVAGSFAQGTMTGVVPYLVINHLSAPIDDFVNSAVVKIVNNGTEIITDSFADNFADALGDSLGITVSIVARTFIPSLINARSSGFSKSLTDSKDKLIQSGKTQAGFLLLDLVLDCFTPLGDPYVTGIVTGLRIAYSGGKMVINYKHQIVLHKTRLVAAYDIAVALAN